MGKNGTLITTITLTEQITDDAPEITPESIENFRSTVYEDISQQVDFSNTELTVETKHIPEEEK